MNYTYFGKNLEVTEGMKYAVETKLSKLDSYFNGEKTAKVVMSTQRNYKRIEVTIVVKDLVIRAEEVNTDMYVAIDMIVDKLDRQMKKQKKMLQKKYHKSIRYEEVDCYDEEFEENDKKIVKRKIINSKPMSDEEAILQLELLNHDFYAYFNIKEVPTIIYKRKDGNYGIIESY